MKSASKLSLLALPFIVLATLSLLYFGALAPEAAASIFKTSIVGNAFVDSKLNYQFVTLVIAVLVLALTYFLTPKNAKRFYQLGDISAPSEPVKWLGIKPSDTWKTVGINFAVIVSLITGIFIYLNVIRGQSIANEHVRYLPFVLVLAVMNSFTEESITRLSLATALYGLVPVSVIHIGSALLFGIPHYFGVPGGILGALMAGFLGWLLSKSIVETRGMFWAWLIHFLQDVIIFFGLFLLAL